jgi:hypothetical protein
MAREHLRRLPRRRSVRARSSPHRSHRAVADARAAVTGAELPRQRAHQPAPAVPLATGQAGTGSLRLPSVEANPTAAVGTVLADLPRTGPGRAPADVLTPRDEHPYVARWQQAGRSALLARTPTSAAGLAAAGQPKPWNEP